MKVSIDWAQQYSNVDLKSIPLDELLARIGEQLGAVEEVTDIGSRYDGIVVARIHSVTKHPNADKLNLCLIDDGGVTEGVNRDESGLVQIVCGAPVVEPGMIVAWLTPGATVPVTADADPFVLDVREIRGIESPGMLGTPHELALNDDHSGLLNISPAEVGPELAKPGTPFKKLYGLDDVIIDCENKMFTHRPDCFGILGVARELAGITGQAFESPSWYLDAPQFETPARTLPLEIFNQAGELAPRIMAVVIDGVKVAPSPIWLQAALTKVGIKSINNIVDITNYLMQLTGQPMHAFDYHKIADKSSGDGATLGPRMAMADEPLTVLGGKKLKLTVDDIVLATDQEPADLAGVIGGGETEIDNQSTTVLLTCASFDMYAVRRSSMRHGVFTEAAMRYTKGQSPLQNDRVLARAMQMIFELAGGHQDGEVIDLKGYGNKVFGSETTIHDPVMVSPEFISDRLGVDLSADQIGALLKNVELDVEATNNQLEIQAPFWRTDIEIAEDVVEEVGRLYGYDKLPRILPPRSSSATPKNILFEVRSRIRTTLSRLGANEILSYSFVHGDLLTKVGQNPDHAFKLKNALSPELQYYRLSLLPSLLDKVHANVRAGHDRFALFELGRAHDVRELDENGLPSEFERLAFVHTDSTASTDAGASYYAAKQYFEQLVISLGIDGLTFAKLSDYDFGDHGATQASAAPFQPDRAAVVCCGDTFMGVVGELKPSVRAAFKLPVGTAGFELRLSALLEHPQKDDRYVPLSRFPSVTQDISLKVSADTPYADVAAALATALDEQKPEDVACRLEPLDIYQGDDQAYKNITFRVHAVSHVRTLQADAVNTLLDASAQALAQTLSAERV